MPIISVFEGIIITMHCEKGERHHTPHFHVRYGDHTAAVTLEGEILRGFLPRKQVRYVKAWAAKHYNELVANWHLTLTNREPVRIDPLIVRGK